MVGDPGVEPGTVAGPHRMSVANRCEVVERRNPIFTAAKIDRGELAEGVCFKTKYLHPHCPEIGSGGN